VLAAIRLRSGGKMVSAIVSIACVERLAVDLMREQGVGDSFCLRDGHLAADAYRRCPLLLQLGCARNGDAQHQQQDRVDRALAS
jgi:hypothetical protein